MKPLNLYNSIALFSILLMNVLGCSKPSIKQVSIDNPSSLNSTFPPTLHGQYRFSAYELDPSSR